MVDLWRLDRYNDALNVAEPEMDTFRGAAIVDWKADQTHESRACFPMGLIH